MSLTSLYGGGDTSASDTSASPYTPNYGTPSDAPAASSDVGKFELPDLSDPIGSIIQSIGGASDAFKDLGQIGVGTESAPHLYVKDVWNTLSAPFRFVGDIPLPSNSFQQGAPTRHVSDLPGEVLGTVVGAPLAALNYVDQIKNKEIARNRIQAYLDDPNYLGSERPPESIMAQARAGVPVDALAQEMVDRNISASSNPTAQFGSDLISSPWNIIGPGLAAIEKGSKALEAVRTADQFAATKGIENTGEAAQLYSRYDRLDRAVIMGYTALVKDAPAALRTVLARATPFVSDGMVHGYGSSELGGLFGRTAAESPLAADKATEALGMLHSFIDSSTLGEGLVRDVDQAVKNLLEPAQIDRVLGETGQNLARSRTLGKTFSQDAENLARGTEKLFLGVEPDVLRADAIRDWALVTEETPEAAARMLGKTMTTRTRNIIQSMLFAKYGGEVRTTASEYIARNPQAAEAAQVARYTLLRPDTLAEDVAKGLLKEVKNETGEGARTIPSDPVALQEAVDRYRILERFRGHDYKPGDVVSYIKQLIANDALPARAGKNIPKEFAALRAKYAETGYELGYSPKSGMKVLDINGTLVPTEVWVPITNKVTPTRIANPLGRLSEGLTRAIQNRRIVMESEQRFARIGHEAGLGEVEMRTIHRQVMRESSEAGDAPRVLAVQGGGKLYRSRISAIFAERLGPERYQELIKTNHPEAMFLRAIEGQVGTVGVTQKFTGAAKAEAMGFDPTAGRSLVWLADYAYPQLRFVKNLVFQHMERVETQFIRTIRGVFRVHMPDDIKELFQNAIQRDPNFKALQEDFGPGYLAKGTIATGRLAKAVPSLVRKLLSPGDVAGGKLNAAIEQAFIEQPEIWHKALNEIDGNMWARYAIEAGTTNERDVAMAFWRNHAALRDADAAGVEKIVDSLKPMMSTVETPSEVAAREAFQSAREAFRKTNPGGNLSPEIVALREKWEAEFSLRRGPIEHVEWQDIVDGPAPKTVAFNPDEETAYQAFMYTMRQATEVAHQSQYYRVGRSFLERSLNHPILGIYPLSYNLKLYGEFSRFLLRRPFGLNAPLTGLAALQKMQRVLLSEDFKSSDTGQWIADHPLAINFLNIMLPGWPTSLGVRLPLWQRRSLQAAEKGTLKPSTPVDALKDQLDYALNPITYYGNIVKAAQELAGTQSEVERNVADAATKF